MVLKKAVFGGVHWDPLLDYLYMQVLQVTNLFNPIHPPWVDC
jgi:hypothetical protein